jgi:beta-glucosidase
MWKVNYVETPSSPLYPFGYGLSYTHFQYTNLRIEPAQVKAGDTVTIRADVRNSGQREGDEVVQVYTHTSAASVTRPVKELKGFARVTLKTGESKTISFRLPVNALGYYDRDMRFVIEPGTVEVMVGSSSDDIRLQGAFAITGQAQPVEKAFFSAVEISD